MQRTLAIIKPDAVQRRLIGKIISRFEEKGLEIIGLKITVLTEDLAKTNYTVHEGKDYFEKLVKFMTSGPVVLLVLRGENAIEVVRKLMGSTSGYEADPGTIRGDYAISGRFNLIHGSDSVESAEREISLFFDDSNIIESEKSDLKWICDMSDIPGNIVIDDKNEKITIPFNMPLREVEKKVIIETLRKSNGNKELAASLLGITTRTIYRKMNSLNEEESEENLT